MVCCMKYSGPQRARGFDSAVAATFAELLTCGVKRIKRLDEGKPEVFADAVNFASTSAFDLAAPG
jgi:hypothetical protein